MEAKIEISMDNAALEDAPATELARILRGLAEAVEYGKEYAALRDSNGNQVGAFWIEDAD